MSNGKMLLLLVVFITCAPVLAYSAGNPNGQPFQYLQLQIDSLTIQLRDLQDRFVAPTISYESSCDGSSLKIELTITGNSEIAYYAIQEQGGDPPTNITSFVEPGLTSVSYQLTVDPGPNARTILFIASDINGNVGKSLLEIQADICFVPVCTPDQTQLCPNQNGACAGTLQYCAPDGKSWLACDYGQRPNYLPTEKCYDYVDNNCDGQVDEGCPR